MSHYFHSARFKQVAVPAASNDFGTPNSYDPYIRSWILWEQEARNICISWKHELIWRKAYSYALGRLGRRDKICRAWKMAFIRESQVWNFVTLIKEALFWMLNWNAWRNLEKNCHSKNNLNVMEASSMTFSTSTSYKAIFSVCQYRIKRRKCYSNGCKTEHSMAFSSLNLQVLFSLCYVSQKEKHLKR